MVRLPRNSRHRKHAAASEGPDAAPPQIGEPMHVELGRRSRESRQKQGGGKKERVSEFQAGAIIEAVGYDFGMPRAFNPIRVFLLLFLIAGFGCASGPIGDLDKATAAAIAGDWGVQIKEGGHTDEGNLHFSFDGTGIVGTYSGPDGEVRELESIRVSATKISWKMDERQGMLTVKGDVNGTIMTGKMKLHRSSDEAVSFSGKGGGGYNGRSPEISYSWTAIKRVEK